MLSYAPLNLNFAINYDKLYKKEYLPSRIRYSQFFFYTFLIGGCYGLLSYRAGGGMFCPKQGNDNNLGNRRYYTSSRSIVNIFARTANKQAASSHASS